MDRPLRWAHHLGGHRSENGPPRTSMAPIFNWQCDARGEPLAGPITNRSLLCFFDSPLLIPSLNDLLLAFTELIELNINFYSVLAWLYLVSLDVTGLNLPSMYFRCPSYSRLIWSYYRSRSSLTECKLGFYWVLPGFYRVFTGRQRH